MSLYKTEEYRKAVSAVKQDKIRQSRISGIK